MGSSGGGGSSSGGTYTMRYAGYIEARHKVFLNDTYAHRKAIISDNPYDGFTDVPVDAGFFGTGYLLASFPAMFDVYGKFVAGLDIDALWEEILESTTESPAAKALVTAESALLNEELEETVLPKFMTGMRDMNATMSSTFINGKALLYGSKQKQLAKFSSELKWKLVGVAQDRYKAHLAWNQSVASSYADLFKTYFGVKDGITRLNYDIKSKDSLWPLTVLDYERANLGALQGAMKQSTDKDSGGGGSFLGGALSGAAAGGMMGFGPVGMVAGAALGGVASLF